MKSRSFLKTVDRNTAPMRVAPLALMLVGTLACPIREPVPDAGGVVSDAAVADGWSDDAAQPDTGFDATAPDAALGLDPVGASSSLEIATWNIQEFPLQGDATIDYLVQIIKELEIDLIAVQEISDMSDFQRVMQRLPEYGTVLSPHVYSNGSYQKTGVVYRRSQISVSNTRELFTDDWFGFPRSAFQLDVVAEEASGGGSYSFTMIVVHLKAGVDDEDHDRRESACLSLKAHLDEQRGNNPGRDYVLLGDFNAKLTGHYNDVFDPFFNDSDFRFLTQPLANAGEWSHPGYEILIDHILIADAAGSDFSGDATSILHLDEELNFYQQSVSDHRPVVTVIEPVAWR